MKPSEEIATKIKTVESNNIRVTFYLNNILVHIVEFSKIPVKGYYDSVLKSKKLAKHIRDDVDSIDHNRYTIEGI